MKESTCEEVRKLKAKFEGLELHHVLRKDKEEVDALSKLASSREQPPLEVFVNDLRHPSVRLDVEGVGSDKGLGGSTPESLKTISPDPN